MVPAISLHRSLQAAGILMVLGLIVEAWTLRSNNPIAFLIFLGIGGVLIFVGIVIYLISLVTTVDDKSIRATGKP